MMVNILVFFRKNTFKSWYFQAFLKCVFACFVFRFALNPVIAQGQAGGETPGDSVQAAGIELIQIYLDSANYYDTRMSDTAIEYAHKALHLSQLAGIPEYQADAYFYKGFAYYQKNDYKSALAFFNKALQLRKKLNDTLGVASALNRMGNAYQLDGNYKQALQSYQNALFFITKTSHHRETARTYTNLGSVYQLFGDYKKAIHYHLKSLNIYDQKADEEGKAWSYLNIGRLFKKMGEYEKALEYVNRSLSIYETIAREKGIKTGITLCLKEKGSIYHNLGDFDKALNYSFQTLEINKNTGNMYGVANAYVSIGTIYYRMKQYDRSLEYFENALKIKKDLDDKTGMPSVLRYIGKLYQQKNQLQTALGYLKKSLQLARQQNLQDEIRNDYKVLSEITESLGYYNTSLDYFKQYSALKDSLNIKEITRLEMQYEFDKAQRQFEFEKEQEEAKLARQKIISNAFVIGFVLMLLLAYLIYRNYKRKQETNRRLAEQNEKIKQKNKEIQEQRNLATEQRDQISKQKEFITESIHYASKIQNAVLPQEKYIQKVLPGHFILFKPRDIVSGDFYWLSKKDSKVVIAVADCTGHGVPGAFMSMLGVSLLNEIVNKNNIDKANEILSLLRKNIVEALHMDEHDTRPKDGMDIALCILDTNTRQLQFSGAHNPLYILRNGELIETKGDRMPIGIHLKINNRPFTNHSLTVEPGDRLYMCTDGFTDQKGGEGSEKYKKSRLKQRLIEIQHLSITEQHHALLEEYETWKGERRQIDDMLIMGIEVDF